MNKYIIIVDDEPKITSMLEVFVKSKKDYPICFENGFDALTFIKNNPQTPISLLVTDFEMPVLNGIDLIKELNSLGHSFPKVLLTSHNDKHLLVDSINNHIFKFIEKPFKWGPFNDIYEEALFVEQKKSKNEDLKKLGEIYSTIIHEINNPLNMILLFTDLIKLNCKKNIEMDPAKLLSQLDHIQNSGNRINSIIQDIKEFINSNPAQIKEFKLDSVYQEVLIGFGAIKNNQKINFSIEKSDITIKMDSGQLYRILINLISNSADAIDDLPEKWIKIISQENDHSIYIRVIDSGTGICPSVVPQLFSKNYSNKKATKGTGLGLDICKKIISVYSGDIKYEFFNGNTSFLVSIPKNN